MTPPPLEYPIDAVQASADQWRACGDDRASTRAYVCLQGISIGWLPFAFVLPLSLSLSLFLLLLMISSSCARLCLGAG
jgi:hypothetical protein